MKNTVNNMPVTPNSGGGGSRGGWLGKLFGMVNARSYEMLARDRFAWQQGLITEEMGKRDTNRAAAQAAGKVVGEKMSLANKRNAAFAFERKRTSKNKKTGEFNYPDLVDFGPAEDPLNARWGSRAGERAALARAAGGAGGAATTPPTGVTPPTVNNTPTTPPNRNAGLDPFNDGPSVNDPAKADQPNLQNPVAKTPKAKKPKAPKAGA
jgi:hypothetical protein